MESVSRIFGDQFSKRKAEDSPLSPEQLVLSAWPRAVGRKIALKTRASKLVRTRLVVEVEDSEWQRSLFFLSRHIVGNLGRAVGEGIVDDLEFRVVPRRKEPQRATASLPLFESVDDADAISDPILRNLYKAARRKATA